MKFSTSALLAVAAFAAKASADLNYYCGPQATFTSMKGTDDSFGFCQDSVTLANQLSQNDFDLLDDPNSDVKFTNGFNNNVPIFNDVDNNQHGSICVNDDLIGADGIAVDGAPFDMQLAGDVTITHDLSNLDTEGLDASGCTVKICSTIYTWGQGGGGNIFDPVTGTSSPPITHLIIDDTNTFTLTDGDDTGSGCSPGSTGVCTRLDTHCIDVPTTVGEILSDDTVIIEVDLKRGDDFYAIDYSLVEAIITCDPCKSETAPDPHFKTFSGDWFDFHGQCDLVLIDVPDYDNETGLSVNIRTTVRYAYSFIETIAIQVGEDILQVSGWGDYMINGISNVDMESATLNGRPVRREIISDKQSKFVVDLENGHHFTIKVFKDMISTSFDLPEEHDVRGILGDRKGAKLARDGFTIIEDANEFGQEWQVQDTDHQLFQTVRAPQFPAQCIMPDPVEREQRRLAATVSQDAAEAACSHVKDEHVRDMCIFDVMSVDDLSLAAGAY